MSPNEVNYLQMIEEQEARFHTLSSWEQGFIGDILERFSDYGEHLVLSENQWRIISQIGEKLNL